MTKYQYTVDWTNGKRSQFTGEEPVEGKLAFHVNSEGCKILVPFAWYKDGEIKELVA